MTNEEREYLEEAEWHGDGYGMWFHTALPVNVTTAVALAIQRYADAAVAAALDDVEAAEMAAMVDLEDGAMIESVRENAAIDEARRLIVKHCPHVPDVLRWLEENQ